MAQYGQQFAALRGLFWPIITTWQTLLSPITLGDMAGQGKSGESHEPGKLLIEIDGCGIQPEEVSTEQDVLFW